MQIIDADGHVNDRACQDEIARYMPEGNRSSAIFPVLDHLHFHYLRPRDNNKELRNPGAEEWLAFLDETGIEWSVLYPTFGLAVGRFVSREGRSPHVLPTTDGCTTFSEQEPKAQGNGAAPHSARRQGGGGITLRGHGAGDDGRHAALQRGRDQDSSGRRHLLADLRGGGEARVLPRRPRGIAAPPGNGFVQHLLSRSCRGAPDGDHDPGGRDALTRGIRAISQPSRGLPRGRSHLGAILHGPARPLVPRRPHANGRGRCGSGGPEPGEKASDYFKRHVRAGRIFVGFDCDDDGLGFAVGKAGRDAFLFGSDFPHEVFDAKKCRHEIDELLERDDLTEQDKAAVLGGNAMRLYCPESV